MSGFRNAQGQAIDGGGVLQTNLNLNSKNLTNGGDISGANANSYILKNLAASTTAATLVPDRSEITKGYSANGSNTLQLVVNGAAGMSTNTSGFLIPSSLILYARGGVQNDTGDVSVGDDLTLTGAAAVNGAVLSGVKSAAQLLSGLSGATVDASNIIPAGSMVWGVVARVTTLITGASSFNIGDTTTANIWGNNIALTAGTTTSPANFAAASFGAGKLYTAATSVRLTANTSNFTAGAVRLVVYYSTISAPTA